ncbi:MAG: phosphotyrosine protein phosphatase [Solirubrobacteraceae bacterium]
MSQALFQRAAGDAHRALSAGTTPADHVHPKVVAAMRELGIDLTDRTPQPLTLELARQADIVVAMGCGDECPVIPGTRYIDWDLPDPPRQDARRRPRHSRRDRPTSLGDDRNARDRLAAPPSVVTSELARGKPVALYERPATGSAVPSQRCHSRRAPRPPT